MTELDEIKQRKMEEIKKKYEEQQAALQQEQQLDAIVRQILTEKAKARLGNVKLVNRELYLNAVRAIIYLYNAGQISSKIDEPQLKILLKKLSGEKREIKIKRK